MNSLAPACRRISPLVAIAAGIACIASTVAYAEPPPATPPLATANLTLSPNGQKWPTDAPLRSSMAAIRTAYDVIGVEIENWTAPPADMNQLGNQIEQYTNAIINNSRPSAEAEPALHYLVADLLRGANLMHGTDPTGTQFDGANIVLKAFAAYGKYFDDPAWLPKQ